MRAVRRTWTIGGIGLVLCGVVGMMQYALPGAGSGIAIVRDVLFAASVLLLAIGLSKESSVVARRPLGVSALVVVAVWPLLIRLAEPFLPTMDADAFDAGLDAYRDAESILTAVSFVNLFVTLAAAAIAVVQIARARVIPRPWQWAPLWALLACVAGFVLPQVLFVSAGLSGSQDIVGVAIVLSALGFLAQTLGLGIIALMLASRVPTRDVDVFRSAQP